MRTEPCLKNLTDKSFGRAPEKQNELLQDLGAPHIDSFNFMLSKGLILAVKDIDEVFFELPNKDRVCLQILDASISSPTVPLGTIGIKNPKIYPTECRQKHTTYNGKLTVTVGWSVNGRSQSTFEKDMGSIPIMIKSDACHLAGISPAELIKHKEHAEEWGGYFIIRGYERLVRMLTMTRRNYPLILQRSSWRQRGALFSDFGVQIRCVAEDETSTNNVLHFVTNGTAKFMFSHRKNLYYAPVMLIMKSLLECSDQYIYDSLIKSHEEDKNFSVCIQSMLRTLHEDGLHTHEDCKIYIAKMFRHKFWEIPTWVNDIEVTDYILKRCVLIHLKSNKDKFNLIVLMTQKLFSFSKGECKVEGADSVMMQELLLGGHLYLQILKEKLSSWLYNLRFAILKRSKDSMAYTLTNQEVLNATKQAGLLQTAIETFLSTGNLSSHSGLGLMQDKGLTIVTENINRMRYMSHFKSVHRGQFFTTMRTTETRQLLPDAWGFICPVHTPDGAPCGLLNHLTMNCTVTRACDPKKIENIQNLLVSYGMKSLETIDSLGIKESYVTVLDGKVLGYTPKKYGSKIVQKLRIEKIQGENIPETTEIAFIEKRDVPTQYPGLYIFTGPSRMMRPVINLTVNKIELIGTLEQVYMSICVKPEEAYEGITTHMEISKTAFLSNLAKLIPMPDCNQSPRNMYQCQMGKQTMGTPIHNWKTLSDTKLYRLETPASPLFRPVHYDNIDLDHYPMGTNAFVAVISYTGYDMEDAMIINKSSYERGLAFGSIYKTEYIELPDNKSFFCRDPSNESIKDALDNDGFPHPGMKLNKDDPLYCYYDENQSKFVIHKSKETEEIMIDNIRIFGGFSIVTPKKAAITYRIVRNPSVGDKFASRAGQKGICSKLWPAEDLPFTETGLIPDIVFNPHGFPSRMTIAMMIEVMAGKSASLHGLVHDATPFRFDEKDTAIDCFGKLLEAGGYNYYGTEPMYSGVNGRELKAHIFCGIVHYQRLRHMVSDKWQVRRTGPVDAITRQPVGGRRRGGGVRFGEMERDALMSHGASFLLQDRLFSCSDRSVQKMCKKCGSLLSPIAVITRRTDKPNMTESRDICKICQDDGEVVSIEIPYIFKYLVMELASINIHVKLQLKHS